MDRILTIRRPDSFELRTHGSNQASVGMKEYMLHALFTGTTAGGVFSGEPVPLFTDGTLTSRRPVVQAQRCG